MIDFLQIVKYSNNNFTYLKGYYNEDFICENINSPSE